MLLFIHFIFSFYLLFIYFSYSLFYYLLNTVNMPFTRIHVTWMRISALISAAKALPNFCCRKGVYFATSLPVWVVSFCINTKSYIPLSRTRESITKTEPCLTTERVFIAIHVLKANLFLKRSSGRMQIQRRDSIRNWPNCILRAETSILSQRIWTGVWFLQNSLKYTNRRGNAYASPPQHQSPRRDDVGAFHGILPQVT
jgi:hypothetical protein